MYHKNKLIYLIGTNFFTSNHHVITPRTTTSCVLYFHRQNTTTNYRKFFKHDVCRSFPTKCKTSYVEMTSIFKSLDHTPQHICNSKLCSRIVLLTILRLLHSSTLLQVNELNQDGSYYVGGVQSTLKSITCKISNWVQLLLPHKHLKNCIGSGSRNLDVPSHRDEIEPLNLTPQIFSKYPFITWICISQHIMTPNIL